MITVSNNSHRTAGTVSQIQELSDVTLTTFNNIAGSFKWERVR